VHILPHIKYIVNVEGDGSYKPPTQDMHDENEVIQSQEMPRAQNANVDSQGKVVGFMNLSRDMELLLLSPPFINIFDILTCTLALGNIRVMQKHNNIFSHVIKFLNKNDQVFVEVMGKMDTIQLEIEQHHSQLHLQGASLLPQIKR
jgi:hypothetical protein